MRGYQGNRIQKQGKQNLPRSGESPVKWTGQQAAGKLAWEVEGAAMAIEKPESDGSTADLCKRQRQREDGTG